MYCSTHRVFCVINLYLLPFRSCMFIIDTLYCKIYTLQIFQLYNTPMLVYCPFTIISGMQRSCTIPRHRKLSSWDISNYVLKSNPEYFAPSMRSPSLYSAEIGIIIVQIPKLRGLKSGLADGSLAFLRFRLLPFKVTARWQWSLKIPISGCISVAKTRRITTRWRALNGTFRFFLWRHIWKLYNRNYIFCEVDDPSTKSSTGAMFHPML